MNIPTQIAPEIEHRLLLSRVEAEELNERDILCPVCGFRIQRVFSDATKDKKMESFANLEGKIKVK